MGVEPAWRRVAKLKLASTIGIVLLSMPAAASARDAAPTRQINLNASTQIEYDSNVFGIGQNANTTFVKSKDDVRITPSLNFDILLPLSRQALYLNGTVGYDFYRTNHSLNRERIDVTGGGRLNLSKCSSDINATYSRMRSDRYALTSVDQITNGETHKAAGISANCGGPIGITVGGNYRHEEVTNSLQVLRQLNYRSDMVGGNIGYTRPTFGTLSIYGNFNDVTYPNRQYIIGGVDIVDDGTKIYSAGLSFERNIGSRITGSVSAGYTWVTPKIPISPKFHGASYSLNLNVRPIDALSLDLIASRDASASNLQDVSYSITELYSLNGNYALSQALSVQFGASYRKQNQKGSPLVNPILQGDYDYLSGNLGMQYRWRKLTFNAGVTRSHRGSELLFQRYNDTRVGAGVALRL
jgi:hypothetical protein